MNGFRHCYDRLCSSTAVDPVPLAPRGATKDALNNLIPIMVRPSHHERNRQLIVRPEPVEGLVQSIPNARLSS